MRRFTQIKPPNAQDLRDKEHNQLLSNFPDAIRAGQKPAGWENLQISLTIRLWLFLDPMMKAINRMIA